MALSGGAGSRIVLPAIKHMIDARRKELASAVRVEEMVSMALLAPMPHLTGRDRRSSTGFFWAAAGLTKKIVNGNLRPCWTSTSSTIQQARRSRSIR
jgi:hypothetical protein